MPGEFLKLRLTRRGDKKSIIQNVTVPAEGSAPLNIYYNIPAPEPEKDPVILVFKISVINEEKGLLLKKFEIKIDNVMTVLYAVFIDPSAYASDIIGMRSENDDGVMAGEIVKEGKVKVVLGSSFVETYQPLKPNGFLKVDGVVVSSLKNNGYNGIVGVQGQKLQLLSSRSSSFRVARGIPNWPSSREGWTQCLQCKTANR